MHAVLITLLLSVSAANAVEPDVVVVCPAEFRQAMEPWLERRKEQGHVVQFVSNLGTAQDVRERIRSVAKEGKLRFVVLVGDAPPQAGGAKAAGAPTLQQCTPTFRVPAKVDCYWGGGPDFVSDNPYADLDDDGLPDLAIGRLTAHSPAELGTMLKKTLAYEECRDFGPWRTRINFLAGEGGFGELTDEVLETIVRKIITSGVPAAYESTLTYGSWHSPYCPDPHSFHARCLQRFNESALFCVYMGHGSPRSLAPAIFPDCLQTILNFEDCRQLRYPAGSPIVLFLACYTGAFAESQDCLAEEMLRSPEGPVAVMGAASVTMPYAMTALGWEAMHEYFQEHRETVGELFLFAKRDTMTGYDLPIWGLVDALTSAAAPSGIRPKEERREHVSLFNLFGDPTMRLHYPREATLSAPTMAAAGQRIEVHGECPIDGPATVELVLRRDRLRENSLWRQRYSSSASSRQQFERTYQMANDPRLATAETNVAKGRFSVELDVPADGVGLCHLRLFAAGDKDCAVGARDIQIVATSADAATSRAVIGKPAGQPQATAPIGAALIGP